MYAIIRTGGKQFKVTPGDTLKVPSIAAEVGDTITIEDVLLGGADDDVKVGAPLLDGASVQAEIVAHGRGEKITVFKWKRRKNYRRKQGHRQGYTEIRVDTIDLG
ncbi:MAG TPA: 50S ribosomal protein L21 [Longimicrobiales bacterium]|jgi:large subunit ribosomal protein L21|nr:50S ribosomal protein L21 [Longimicrobiales bacterium]